MNRFRRMSRTLGLGCALLAWIMVPATAQTFSDAFAGLGSNNGEPIQIEAQELKVEDKDQSATFSGNVVVRQGEAVMKTQRLVVRYDGSATGGVNQRISSLRASGRVLIESRDQQASGDQATFDMDRQIMVMTGKEVILTQGPNVLVGTRLTVNLNTGRADMDAASGNGASGDGRIRVLIQPNSVQSPPAGN